MIKEVSENHYVFETSVLNQLILSLEKSIEELQKAYEEKDKDNFNNIKKLILKTQKQINEILI